MKIHISIRRISPDVVRLIAERKGKTYTWERRGNAWYQQHGKKGEWHETPQKDDRRTLDQLVTEREKPKLANRSVHEHPTIRLKPGKLPRAVDRAESILLDHCERLRIFQRAGELVQVISLPQPHEDGRLRRPKGSVQLEPLSGTVLTEVLNRHAEWRRNNDSVRVDCPPKIAATYLSRIGTWRVPVLAGIISTPMLREDGTILSRLGYDKKSGLLLVTDEDWPSIPEHPTVAEAKTALKTLIAPFEEFPFVREEDLAVHIACILTAIQRPLLRACPIVGYSAPTQRSGKSLLAESVAIITTGKPAPATAVSGDKEEIRKMILSVLREGHPIVNLDNVEHPLASPALAKAITQSEYEDRLLGTSRMLHFPTSVLWTVTGNNLLFRGDLSSRALLSRIDPRMESPESRTFKIPQLVDHLKRHRRELVVAALTILRAYHVAGRPRQQVKPWGGFDDWSAMIREPLVWLDLADPCKTRTGVLAEDPEREGWSAALHALRMKFEDDEFTTREILEECSSSGTLRRAMEIVAVGRHKEIDSQSLGWFLRHTKDRVLGNLRLEAVGQVSGVARWRVAEAPGGHVGHGGQFPAGGVRRFPRLGNTPAKDGRIKRFPRLPEKQ